MTQVTLSDINKFFGDNHILKAVNLTITSGEFIVLVGPSGCGKSTLLRAICGLEEHDSGQIYLDDLNITELPASDRNISMVFQSYALYPHMSVKENLTFGLKNIKLDDSIIEERIAQAAQILQLTALLDRKPQNLSGGQRQRVAIGRAIVQHPKVFLFDEPLSNLDASLRVQMRQELSKLHKTLQSTIIYVTHDQIEAMTLASRIVILNGGHVEQIGTPLEVYNRPSNIFVAEFMGAPKINIIPLDTLAHISQSQPELAKLMEDWKQKSIHSIGIRPEKIQLGSLGEIKLSTQCNFSELLGDSTVLYNDFIDQEIRVKIPHQYQPKIDESIEISFLIEDLLYFDVSGNALY